MNQCDRLKLILQENKLKQKQLATEIGVTESYISKLLKNPNIRLSQSLATLIEEKYGYHAAWILNAVLAFINSLDDIEKFLSNGPKSQSLQAAYQSGAACQFEV